MAGNPFALHRNGPAIPFGPAARLPSPLTERPQRRVYFRYPAPSSTMFRCPFQMIKHTSTATVRKKYLQLGALSSGKSAVKTFL